jgi:AP-1 complex subunit beta-1
MLSPAATGQPASSQIQVAIKNMAAGNVFYFAVSLNFESFFGTAGALERTSFIESWKSIDDQKELYGTVSDLPDSSTDIDRVIGKFRAYNIFFVARRPVPNAEGQEVVYFSMKTIADTTFLAELTFKSGVNACKVCVKAESTSYAPLAKTALETILCD